MLPVALRCNGYAWLSYKSRQDTFQRLHEERQAKFEEQLERKAAETEESAKETERLLKHGAAVLEEKVSVCSQWTQWHHLVRCKPSGPRRMSGRI